MGGWAVWVDLTDEELVAASLLGRLAAFDELVRRFRPAVRLTAKRYADDAEASEDLCQEAFLRAFKALRQLGQPSRFGAWLHAIVRNLALREQRDGARRRERFSTLDLILLEQMAALDPSPHQLAEQCETQRLVQQAVGALPPPYREVVTLYYWDGMPLPRIAAYMGIPLTTAKWRLLHARERLERSLARCGDLFE
jgi:RNA polymerase sigma-70 factor (ECF subfamily)